MYVTAIEVRNGEVSVEPDVLHLMSGLQAAEPLARRQLCQDVVVDVDLKAENLAFLEHRLRVRVCTSGLAVLVAALGPMYLKGDDWNSETRRGKPLLRSRVLLRTSREGLSAIN